MKTSIADGSSVTPYTVIVPPSTVFPYQSIVDDAFRKASSWTPADGWNVTPFSQISLKTTSISAGGGGGEGRGEGGGGGCKGGGLHNGMVYDQPVQPG